MTKLRVEGLEMAPLEVRFAGTDQLSVGDLPSGAIFDATARTLRWLPKRGQAGVVTIPVQAGAAQAPRSAELEIAVAALPETRLRQGPLDVYQDDDVGYVFVHGMTQSNACDDPGFTQNYWGGGVQIIAPAEATRTSVCYDGSRRVQDSVASVMKQIADAPCGRFNRCIVVTHSLGGLMLEHILTQQTSDLAKKVAERVLMVVAMGSAAGGSEAANILTNPDAYPFPQNTLGQIAQATFFKAEAVADLTLAQAAILAPPSADPGVPFFMIPGFSTRQLGIAEATGVLRGEPVVADVFNGYAPLAATDAFTAFSSRSDGLVAFRSSCGTASMSEKDGPGRGADLASHLAYCHDARKKPNHFLWFAINLNHMYMIKDFAACAGEVSPCEARFPSAGQGLAVSSEFRLRNAPRIVRDLLTRGASAFSRATDVPAF